MKDKRKVMDMREYRESYGGTSEPARWKIKVMGNSREKNREKGL